MGEIENNNGFKMQFIDKLIVSMIGGMSLIVIIITVLFVNNKYKRLYDEQLRQLNEIPYNETYKYMKKDNSITFYKDITEVTSYKCSTDCDITDFSSSQFIIDNDDLIPIIDNGKVSLYSIKNKKNTIINNKYGIIKINNKYGVINKKGRVILNCLYNDIDINFSHIVTLSDKTVSVFDNNARVIASKVAAVKGDISISEKNDHLYINIIGDKTVTIVFDTKTNKFIK